MTFTLDKYMPYTVGFDRFFDTLDIVSNTDVKGYPHYNIKKIDDFNWQIEMALAGFGKKDISVETANGQLKIQSVDSESDSKDDEVIHRGISKRKFTKSFTLADDVVVNAAELKDGMLLIDVEKIVPEEKKPRTIKIK